MLVFLTDTDNLFGRYEQVEPTPMDYSFECCEGDVQVSLTEGRFFRDEIMLAGDLELSEDLHSPIGGTRNINLLYKNDGFEMRGGGDRVDQDFTWYFDNDQFDEIRGWHEGNLYPFEFYGIEKVQYWSDEQAIIDQAEVIDTYWTEDKGYPAYVIIYEVPKYEGWKTSWDISLDIDYETAPYATRLIDMMEDKGTTAIMKRTVYYMEDFDKVGETIDAEVRRCRVTKTYALEEPIFTITGKEEWTSLK